VSETANPVTADAEYASADLVSVRTLEDAVVFELSEPQADRMSAKGVVPSAAAFLLFLSFSENSPNTVTVPAFNSKDFAVCLCPIFSSLRFKKLPYKISRLKREIMKNRPPQPELRRNKTLKKVKVYVV
jgi:hypothetical protein